MRIDKPDILCCIDGAGVLSPQKTYDNLDFLTEIRLYDQNILTCVLPAFKDYINPFQLRRLSRMLRMGLSAAVICLREAQLSTPDAVITATGYGFQDDMAKFLTEILEQKEEQLTPTYFMQSTYNALAGLIALSVKCTGYNNTYTSKGFAFESALHDAMMLLREKEARQVLVGSFDEVSPVQYSEYVRKEWYKKEKINNLELFESKTTGALQGEGVAFFVLSDTPSPRTWCLLKDMRMVYKPSGYGELARALQDFLKENGKVSGDIDVFVNGVSGDAARDLWNLSLGRDFLGQATEVRFKHLTGEYATASSFALWLGAMILKHRRIPDAVRVRPAPVMNRAKTVLVCNHFLARNYSFLLLEKGGDEIL